MERRVYLDGLRGVAACVVFFGHLSLALTGQNSAVFNANSAVCIFFILSSYVLSQLAQQSNLNFAAQAARRYCRLVIPMLFTSVISCALLKFHLYQNTAAASATGSTWLNSFYQFHGSFHKMIVETVYSVFLGGYATYNPNLWTMSPELLGSLYIFAVNSAIRCREFRAIFYLLFAVALWEGYMPLFSAGALLYEYRAELERIATTSARVLPVIALGSGLVCCLATRSGAGPADNWYHWAPWLNTETDQMRWHGLGATLLVLAVLYLPALQAPLQGAVGRFLGRISFTLYLIHLLVICSFMSALLLWLPGHPTIVLLAMLAFTFALCACLASVIDRMPTRWSRAVGEWINAKEGISNSRVDAPAIFASANSSAAEAEVRS